MAIDIVTVPADEKVIVAVSGGFDSAVLWYSVYKKCLELGQECVAVTAPQDNHCVAMANSVISYVHSILGGPINETMELGSPGFDPENEDSSYVVGRMFDVIDGNTAEYGRNVYIGNAATYDPSGDLENYKQYRFGTTDIEQLLIDTRTNINWLMPFRNKTKVDIIQHMQELDSDVCNQMLSITSSCNNPSGVGIDIERCDVCFSCIERFWACEQTGITDPGTK